MRLHASNFGIQFLSHIHNIKIFNSYKPFLKPENRKRYLTPKKIFLI